MATIREIELTDICNGEKIVCKSLRDAAATLERSTCYVREKINGEEYLKDRKGNLFRGRFLNAEYIPGNLRCGKVARQQLCWKCKKSGGKCSWSRKFKPVPGWVAVETQIHNSYNSTFISYNIIECPEFIEG